MMAHNPDLFMAYLGARDLMQDLLLAYADDIHRGTVSPVRTGEVNKQFRELADRLGFEVVERARPDFQEAAE